MKLIFIPIFALFLTSSIQAAKWEKIRDDDGIIVHKQDLKNSSLISFKGTGKVKAPISKVLNIILDTNRAHEWAADLEESKVLKWIEEPGEYVEYNHINMPLILSDRDFISILKVHVEKKTKSLLVKYTTPSSSEYQKAYKSGNVLGDLDGSYFRLTSADNGKSTLLEGVVVCDPKGMLPKWLVNLFQEDWPYSTIMSIRKQALKADVINHPRYKNIFL